MKPYKKLSTFSNQPNKETNSKMQIIQQEFTVHDVAAGVFNKPFYEDSIGLAMRGFKTMIDEPTSQICKFPEDFELYYLGTFNQATAEHTHLRTPMPIMNAKTGPRVDPNDQDFVKDLACTYAEMRKAINEGSLLEEVTG